MAKKNVNRAKQYKHQMRHLLKQVKPAVVAETVKTEATKAVKATEKAIETSVETVEGLAEKLGGLALDRAQTFFDEGIKTVADFANWTEKELLALKGIGPATIKKLRENGVKFK